jgi:Tfp pilus assembly protein PilX
VRDRYRVEDDDNPRRWTRRDAIEQAVVTLVVLIVLGLIGMVVLHP